MIETDVSPKLLTWVSMWETCFFGTSHPSALQWPHMATWYHRLPNLSTATHAWVRPSSEHAAWVIWVGHADVPRNFKKRTKKRMLLTSQREQLSFILGEVRYQAGEIIKGVYVYNARICMPSAARGCFPPQICLCTDEKGEDIFPNNKCSVVCGELRVRRI